MPTEFLSVERWEHTVSRLQARIDRDLVERERIRLALRDLVTMPGDTEVLERVRKIGKAMNPDLS